MEQVNGFSCDSGSIELDQKIKEWIQWDQNEDTRNEILTAVRQQQWTELRKMLLGGRLAFGTAGLRGPMKAGYKCMNDLVIVQTAQGLLRYVQKCFPSDLEQTRGIVLGYDGRYNSERFAQITASVFLTANIPVWLFSKMVPTPFVPFTILEKRCLAGVMVTASHNPKEDNGYKVYWSNGAQIISPHDKNIEQSILKNLEPWPSSWDKRTLQSPLLDDPHTEMTALYYKKLIENIPDYLIDYNAKANLDFIYSAMHGVGYDYIRQAFEHAKLKPVTAVTEQRDPNPDFPTVKFPNPEEDASLTMSFALGREIRCDRVLANDPDADRLAFAIAETELRTWKILTGNEIGALLAWWSLYCYRLYNPIADLSDCYMLTSTVSSKFIRAMARIEGFQFIETLTGFKWMGNKCVELMEQGKTALFAFEEAIGFMVSPTVLDKDGISAACHLATMASYLHLQGKTLSEYMKELYLKYGYHYTINSYYICHDPDTICRIFDNIRNYNGIPNEYPKSVMNGEYKIEAVRDLTTGVDTSEPDGRAKLPCSKSSQMITFNIDANMVVTLRTSGTEPKIKYYTEIFADPKDSAPQMQKNLRYVLQDVVIGIINEWLQPEKNGLIARD